MRLCVVVDGVLWKRMTDCGRPCRKNALGFIIKSRSSNPHPGRDHRAFLVSKAKLDDKILPYVILYICIHFAHSYGSVQ